MGRCVRSTRAMTLLPLLLGRDSSTPRFLSLGTRQVVSIHLNSVAHSRGRAFAGPYGRFRSPVGPQSPARVLRLRFPHNHAACDVPRFRTRTRRDHSGSLGLHVVTAAVVRVLQHVVPAMRVALNWFGSVRSMASTPTSRPSIRVVSVWFGLPNMNGIQPDSLERWSVQVEPNMSKGVLVPRNT